MPPRQPEKHKAGLFSREWREEHRVALIVALIGAAATLLAAVIALVPPLAEQWNSRDEGTRDQVAACMDRFGMSANPESTKQDLTATERPDGSTPVWRQTFEQCQWPAPPYADAFGHTEIINEMNSISTPDSHPWINLADRINANCTKVELGYTSGYVEDLWRVTAEQGQQILAGEDEESQRSWPDNRKIFNGPSTEIVALHGGLM